MKFTGKLCIYVCFAVCFVGSLVFDSVFVPPENLRRRFSDFGGKWKYLTHLNMWLQSIYWCVAVAAGLSTLSYENGGRKGVLHRLFDTIHTSLAFPVGIFVCVTFWMIYAVDRELIYPTYLDALVPSWLNHVMHTAHLPFLIIDKYIVLHRYPSQKYGLSILIFFSALYNIWILYLALEKNIWVYPILEVMNWTYRIIFFALLWCFFFLLYKTGELMTLKFWGAKMVKKSKTK